MPPRHFLTGAELAPAELEALLDRAAELKAAPPSSDALAGRSVALLFEQPSTRTRVSFKTGIVELGGHPLVLRPGERIWDQAANRRHVQKALLEWLIRPVG